MRVLQSYATVAILGLGIIVSAGPLAAEDPKDAMAYKLAVFYTRALNPQEILVKKLPEPARSDIAEFQWIMDTLKSRCVNSEDEIADTIVQAWQLVKSRGSAMSLLDVAHALTVNAQDSSRFGPGKVDFKRTSGFWTSQRKFKTR